MMLIKVDAKSLEWKVAVMLSKDKVGIEEILDGQDVHSLNQAHFKLPAGPEGRHIAKIYLFRTIYRGSGYSFSKDNDFMHVSKDRRYWDWMNEQFYTKYYGLNETHQQWSRLVIEGKPLVSPFGRIWKIPMAVDQWGEPLVPWTTLSNYPVQGTGHDIVALARIYIRNQLLQNKLKTKLISTVHDDIMGDAPQEEINQVAKIMYDAFDSVQGTVKELYKYDTVIPFEGEVKVGPNMADMKDLTLKELV